MTVATEPSRRAMTNKQTTLRMTRAMADAYTLAYRAKYGSRGASRWIEEAMVSFLDDPSFATKVGIGEAKMVFDAAKGVGLTPEAQQLLESGVWRYRRIDPLAEGVSSQILRAAIRLRLEAESIKEEPLSAVQVRAGSFRRPHARKQ